MTYAGDCLGPMYSAVFALDDRPNLEPRKSRSRLKVFVAYKREDREFACECKSLMSVLGIEVILYDPESPWTDPISTITSEIRSSHVLAVIAKSARQSAWVDAEKQYGRAWRVTVISVSVADPPKKIQRRTRRVAKGVARKDVCLEYLEKTLGWMVYGVVIFVWLGTWVAGSVKHGLMFGTVASLVGLVLTAALAYVVGRKLFPGAREEKYDAYRETTRPISLG